LQITKTANERGLLARLRYLHHNLSDVAASLSWKMAMNKKQAAVVMAALTAFRVTEACTTIIVGKKRQAMD
jgi:hypothetical protein